MKAEWVCNCSECRNLTFRRPRRRQSLTIDLPHDSRLFNQRIPCGVCKPDQPFRLRCAAVGIDEAVKIDNTWIYARGWDCMFSFDRKVSVPSTFPVYSKFSAERLDPFPEGVPLVLQMHFSVGSAVASDLPPTAFPLTNFRSDAVGPWSNTAVHGFEWVHAVACFSCSMRLAALPLPFQACITYSPPHLTDFSRGPVWRHLSMLP